ncbi:MAG: MFS transporter [Armatimonadota bacterium]|nr:MFS transporter [Armatimonadota bacterium]MDR5696160.1 MFS transporter [Armatimonadota bacterium]
MGVTAAIGLGYFGVQAVRGLYDAYLPLLYGRFLTSNTLIGLVMILDNIASVTVQPYSGALSDRIDTRIGRRLPFLLVGAPLTAVLFAWIPRVDGLVPLLAVTLLMNVAMFSFTSPSMALMPDVTPRRFRGRANGILSLMAGLGTLTALFALSPLYGRSPTLPFDAAGVVLVAALLVIFLVVRERRMSLLYAEDARGGSLGEGTAGPPAPIGEGVVAGQIGPTLRVVLRGPNRSVYYLLLACTAWVAAINGVQNMFTRYGVHHLGLDAPSATMMLGVFVLPFIAAAVPAGYLGDRTGRLRAVRWGLGGVLAAFALLVAFPYPLVHYLAFAAGGVAYALVITNSYPVLVNLTPPEQAGTYTGLWNLAIAVAGLVSAPLYGAVVDLLGFRAFFLPGAAFMLAALRWSLRVSAEGVSATP